MRRVPGRMTRSDEHDVADPLRDQLHPAKDEGAHENLTQLTVGLHDGQEMFAIDLHDFARHRPRERVRTRGGPRAG